MLYNNRPKYRALPRNWLINVTKPSLSNVIGLIRNEKRASNRCNVKKRNIPYNKKF